MKAYFAAIFILFGLFACGDQGIQINDPWIREAPPNVSVLAAYMIIKNPSSQPRTLSAVISAAFEHVEIHQTKIQDGMMQMEHQPELIIAAKSQVDLKPGSYHLMLMGRKKPLVAGDEIELTLKFVNGEEIPITVPVRKSP